MLQGLSLKPLLASENGKVGANVHLAYIPELNGLRAVAVGAVLLDHTLAEHFPGGFIGVDLFFVLSGWLITTILVREFERDNGINLGHFYARRALRLAPALLALLVAYTLLLFLKSVLKPDGAFVQQHLWAVLATGFYIMNWTQAFDLGPSGFLLHTWSLGIEEQFYLFWPVILIGILRYFGHTSAWRLVLILIVIVVGWRVFLVFEDASSWRIYHAFDTRIDTILIGCLLALAPLGQAHLLVGRFSLCPVLILTITLLTLTSRFLYFLGIPIIAFCAAWLILATLVGKPQSLLRQLLRWSPLTYCGQISYGFYLWHFPILIIVANYVSHQNFGQLKTLAITAILTLLIASASYHLLELPALRLRGKFQSKFQPFPRRMDVAMRGLEAERRVSEFNALVGCQRRLIQQLERSGKDTTSAQLVFDSLCVSLSLYIYIHDRHRVRRYVESERSLATQTRSSWEPKPGFCIVPRIALRGGETPVSTKNEIKRHLDKAPVVPDESVQEKANDQLGDFGFRSLTEEEKREFLDSLGAKGKKMLAELMTNDSSSEPLQFAKLSARLQRL